MRRGNTNLARLPTIYHLLLAWLNLRSNSDTVSTYYMPGLDLRKPEKEAQVGRR